MAKVVTVEPVDLWDYYHDHEDELKTEMHEIAEDAEKGVSIYITDNGGKPAVVVVVDEEEAYRENMISSGDCNASTVAIFNDWLDGYREDPGEDEEIDDPYGIFLTDSQKDNMILEREEELEIAFEDLAFTLLGGSEIGAFPGEMEALAAELKDLVIDYVAKMYNGDFYRPQYIVDEYGTESFELYPYKYDEVSCV